MRPCSHAGQELCIAAKDRTSPLLVGSSFSDLWSSPSFWGQENLAFIDVSVIYGFLCYFSR